MSPLSNILVTPKYFDYTSLPQDIKQFYLNKNRKHIPERITNLLRTPTRGKSFQKGLRFLKLCDKRNNTNFLEEWPEFKPYV